MALGGVFKKKEKDTAASEKPKRTRRPRYKGSLDGVDSRVRWAILVIIAIMSFSTTFTQLGFADFGFFGGESVYMVLMLVPIASTAILLGTREAAFIGFVAGVALYWHAQVMPLDVYELKYVSVFSSIILMTATGAFMGGLLRRALRNNPQGVRRYVYIGLVCLATSLFFSFFFVICAMVKAFLDRFLEGVLLIASNPEYQNYQSSGQLPEQVVNEALFNDLTVDEYAAITSDTVVARLGNIRLQTLLDAFQMWVVCVVVDRLSHLFKERVDNFRIRPLFSMWLFLVVLVSFSVVSALSFVTITLGERSRAIENIKEDLDYLCAQLSSYDDRSIAFMWFSTRFNASLETIDTSTLSEEEQNYYNTLMGVGKVLGGYDVNRNGLAFVFLEDYLLECNDPRVSIEGTYSTPTMETTSTTKVRDVFSDDIIMAIKSSLASGETQRVVYGDAVIVNDANGLPITSGNDVGFLCAKDVNGLTVVIIQPSSIVYARRVTTMRWMRFMTAFLLIEVFVLTLQLLMQVVINPVRKINDTLSDITGGNLDARVGVEGTVEFKELSAGINQTVDALNGWIAEAETRIAAELAAAKAIQESALPRNFPAFPDIPHFDLFARMDPAKEVGGDFYDFFLVGDDCTPDQGKLGFVMADVSGKGIPASLFMMKAKTQLRDYLVGGMELGEAVAHANDQLCDGNDAGMFVTAWVGVLDYATGHIDYVNAGHNPPLLLDADGDGTWTWLKQKSGLPLGLYSGMPYRAHSVDCHTGDKLLMYTDGVSEAMNKANELYGEERLEMVANRIAALPPKGIVEAVREDVDRFADGAEQADDITIMLLEIGSPSDVAAQTVVKASIDELSRVHELVHAELDRLGCPDRAREQLDIAVEELFVNVASYAYPDATPENPGEVLIHCTCTIEPPSITIDIVDRGIPFDPLAKPDAVMPKDIADVPIGGLGILMAKRSVDEMSYHRVGDSNILTIVKRW